MGERIGVTEASQAGKGVGQGRMTIAREVAFVVGVVSFLGGVAAVYWPAALIVGGLLLAAGAGHGLMREIRPSR